MLRDARLDALLRYWSEQRNGSPLPPRSAIDPLDMPTEVLPFLMLVDVIPAGERRRYRYRLFGTEMVIAAKGDMTWRFLDECVPEKDGYRDYILALYESLVQERRPLYSTGDFLAHAAPGTLERSTQRLMLPLGTPEDGVTHVLAGQILTAHVQVEGHPMHSAALYREHAHRFLQID